MFTGIVEEIGSISRIQKTGDAYVLTISAERILEDVKLGDSIAVNGVCLTVTSFSKSQFKVDVMPETIKASSLRTLTIGSNVNLERAMAAGGRFGGHFVSGHIDSTGLIKSKKPFENAVYFEIETEPKWLNYIILKGSVCLDGTSLTVFNVTDNSFTISLIPHTMSETILGDKNTGDVVNIECDMISKYVGHFLTREKSNSTSNSNSAITREFLEENGFK